MQSSVDTTPATQTTERCDIARSSRDLGHVAQCYWLRLSLKAATARGILSFRFVFAQINEELIQPCWPDLWRLYRRSIVSGSLEMTVLVASVVFFSEFNISHCYTVFMMLLLVFVKSNQPSWRTNNDILFVMYVCSASRARNTTHRKSMSWHLPQFTKLCLTMKVRQEMSPAGLFFRGG